jgi:hypothetical protein
MAASSEFLRRFRLMKILEKLLLFGAGVYAMHYFLEWVSGYSILFAAFALIAIYAIFFEEEFLA